MYVVRFFTRFLNVFQLCIYDMKNISQTNQSIMVLDTPHFALLQVLYLKFLENF